MFVAVITVCAGLVSAGVLALLIPQAPHLGLMDLPGERRRIHREAIPRIGGLGVFAGLMTVALLMSLWRMTSGLGPEFLSGVPETAGGMSLSSSAPLWTRSAIFGLLGAVLVVVVGVLDDHHHLAPRVRLFAQAGAGLLLSLGGGRASRFPG